MRQEWGREENAGEWPGGRARATLFAFFVAVLTVAGIFYYRYAEEWTALERFYLAQYVQTRCLHILLTQRQKKNEKFTNHDDLRT